MELKWVKFKHRTWNQFSSNRTFMELKYGNVKKNII